MKKRLLGILLCLCMVLTIFPALAFAEGDEPETPVCACETACALDAMNADCPVCGAEGTVPESCGQYTAPAETPVCTCETACALDAMNADCPVCGGAGTVPESCGQYTAPAETPVCTCETACALDAMNAECSVCGAEGTVPESCGQYTAPAGGTVDLQDLDDTVKQAPADDTEDLQKLLNDAPDFSAVKLTEDYTISSTLTVGNTITLDLNGHVIRMNGSGSMLEVFGALTLVDSDPYAAHEDSSLPAGGVITGGNAEEGGGVHVFGHFSMNGGTIFGCQADRGGGVYVIIEGSFTMNDGAIKGCTAQVSGGGVYAKHHFIMNGGAIEDCSAASNGQAVYITETEFIANYGTIKGTVCVADNGRIVTNAGDSYARFYDQVTIESGTISAGIYYGGIAPGPEVITESYNTVSFDLGGGSGSIPKQYFVGVAGPYALKPADPTKEGYTFVGWYIDDALTIPFNFESSPVESNPTLYAKFEDGTKELQKLLNDAPDFSAVKLTEDYTISSTLTVSNMITLDLNGHVIRMTGRGSVIAVYGTMTLTDSNPTATHADSSLPAGGVITGGHATDGGGVYATGDFTMTGGTIYNCTAAGDGGGVYAANRFTMTGGAIDNCTAGGKGGGVYCADQAFTMTGGAIKGCKADFGGGVFAQRGGFMMTGGAIEDCIAYTDGQAVYIFGAGFLADGGTVEGTVYVGGNGLIAHDAGTSFTKFYDPVTIKKGTISYGVYYGGIKNYEGNVDAPYHTVDFNLGGGSGSVPTQFFVGIDTAPALKPADPTKEGYTFAGWFTDEACTTAYDFTSLVTENRTLYAGFKAANDTVALQDMLYAAENSTVKLEQDYTISQTLEAHHVTLDLNGHVIRMTGIGSVIQASGTMTLTDSNPTATHADSSLPAGGVITGSYAEEGGGVLSRGRFTMTGGTIYNCEATRGGGVYVKEGLFTMNDGAIKGCSAQVAGGGVYAERAFIMNGGAIKDCSANYNGQAVYMKTYEFIANSGTIKGTVCVADNGRIATDAGTSYARFYDQVTIENGSTISAGIYYGGIAPGPSVITESYHTVDFNLGGGSGSVPTQFFVGIDTATALKPADPTKDGAVFTGWFTDAALTTPYDFTAPVTGNLTLYAGYAYTITYDPGEYGTGSIPAGTKEHGKDFILTADTFTRQGYVQYAWISAELDWYPLGGTYSTDANVTLYPVWDKIETMTVPFTTTVTLGSSAAPGETVFTLELVDANGKPVSNDAVTVSGSVTTNGAGSYNGALTLTGPKRQIQWLLSYGTGGVFVRQVDAGAAGWTLDGRVWGVALGREESDTTESGLAFSLRIYPVKVVDGKYVLDSNAGPVEQMAFSNFFTHTHRYSQYFNDTEHWDECPCGDEQNRAPHRFGDWVITSRPTGTATGLKERKCADCDYVQSAEIPKLSPTASPGTGDTSKLALWLALLGVSAAGLSAAALYGKRRKGFRQ